VQLSSFSSYLVSIPSSWWCRINFQSSFPILFLMRFQVGQFPAAILPQLIQEDLQKIVSVASLSWFPRLSPSLNLSCRFSSLQFSLWNLLQFLVRSDLGFYISFFPNCFSFRLLWRWRWSHGGWWTGDEFELMKHSVPAEIYNLLLCAVNIIHNWWYLQIPSFSSWKDKR